METLKELRDDPDASTSTIPRTWFPVSKRWRRQLEKLVKMDDSEVKKVHGFVFGKGREFHIAQGRNGVEVFLGLRDDGTEVAVKRMSKTCNLYKDLKNDQLRLPELDDPSIVGYVDFVEDEDYGYLVLQLCEYTLEEYITELPEQGRKQLAEQVLNSLRILHCQDSKILHRDIKPENVLIDIQGNARLSGFGISRRIDKGETTYHSTAAGTSCWMAKETLDPVFDRYKRSTDIQPAGMLIHYILSGGHHPFLEDTTNGTILECQNNISKGNYYLKPVVDDDVVAKDLVEWMIHRDPEERPTVEQCLGHPFFWPNTRREEYLKIIGNQKEVVSCLFAEQDENKTMDEEEKKLIKSLKVLIAALEQYAEQGQFNAWKQKFREEADEETRLLFEIMDESIMGEGPDGKKTLIYPDNSFGLLHFSNLYAHFGEKGAGINLMKMFPDLFGYVYKFAKEQDWNSRSTLKDMFDSTVAIFTPTVDKEETHIDYRFKFPGTGLFQCSVTGLVFVTTGEGAVLYRAVEWDERCLQSPGAPAGPLFDIQCPEQSVCQLRLLHCEVTLDHDLSVAHITDEGVEFLEPLEVTKTHVVVNVLHLSRFGLVTSTLFKAKPINGQVLLFPQPLSNRLKLFLLPSNVPREEVWPNNKEVKGVPAHCILTPNKDYSLESLDCNLAHQASQTFRRHYGTNYHSTFEILVGPLAFALLGSDGKPVWKFNLPSQSVEELHQALSRMVVADAGNVARADADNWNWDPMPESPSQTYPIRPGSLEYNEVLTRFKDSCNNEVIKIERIQIPKLRATFEIKTQELEEKNGHKDNEKLLFHGTCKETVQFISNRGFNRAYAGKNDAEYGQGTYFAMTAAYSAQDRFSKPDDQGQRYMYLCRVLTGDHTLGKEGIVEPPAKMCNNTLLYDSVVDDMQTPNMFVVFHDIVAYPAYLITFM